MEPVYPMDDDNYWDLLSFLELFFVTFEVESITIEIVMQTTAKRAIISKILLAKL
jgi:hypothetical protein